MSVKVIDTRVGFKVLGCNEGVQFKGKYLASNLACTMMTMAIIEMCN